MPTPRRESRGRPRYSARRPLAATAAVAAVVAVATLLVLSSGVSAAAASAGPAVGSGSTGSSSGTSVGASSKPVTDPDALVNPFIGTNDGGDTFPGADVPFGMVQWSPDTVDRPDGGGYEYRSKSIIGYSLTHLSGPGCSAEGDLPILPTLGAIPKNPTAATEPLVHSDESASPGYYQLDAGGIDTQLTTTTRSGMAEFTFPPDTSVGNLLFKLGDSQNEATSSHFSVVSDDEVQGQVTSGYFCGASNIYTLNFDMVFDHPFATSGSWATNPAGDYVSFDTASYPAIEAKVGISYVSVANAVQNRTTENRGWNFTAVRNAAAKSWTSMLDKIAVGGGTATQQTVFYTSLYHSLLDPSVFSDVNGQYLGADGTVHTVAPPQTAQYANYSGWDIYRSEIQLEAMLAPQQTNDIVTSMLNDYAQSGQLPKWDEDNGETYIMVGDPADSIIADAYAFGATDFDAPQALSDMETEAEVPSDIRPGLSYDQTDGYLPIDGTYGCCNFYGPVSTQQEYDTADNSIAELAAALGDTQTARTFAVRAQNWQNVFNPGTGFLQPKEAAGMFQPGFAPTSQNGFVEADSYVYTAMIPFDVSGLIAASGGDGAWVQFLNGLTSSVTAQGPTQIQMGDEPSFDIPWEYDYAGDPARTQEVVREIQDRLFTDTPGGLAGNDDLGAMSSWYVWSALGAYPETPGSADVALGSPLFPTITVALADGKTLTESAPAATTTSPYVDALTFGGAPLPASTLPAGVFAAGGQLSWTLGATPTDWATAPGDGPPSSVEGLLPALGYLPGGDDGEVVVSPGGTASLAVGIQSMSGTGQQVRWSASAASGSGMTMTPDTGVLTVSSEAKATETMDVHVPAGLADGQYSVTVALRAAGISLPAVVAVIDVA